MSMGIEFRVIEESTGEIIGFEFLKDGEWQHMLPHGSIISYGVFQGNKVNRKYIRQQFTGLEDINFQKIYEADTVDTHPFYKRQGNCMGKKRFQKVIFRHGWFQAEHFDFGWEGEGVIDLSQCKII